jgi:ribosomal protein L11 methyltransferase
MTDPAAAEPRFPFVLFDVDVDGDGDDAAASADVWSAALFDLGAQGVEERDATTLVKGTAGKITLVASFETEAEAEEARAALEAEQPGGSPRIEVVVGDAWRDAWKEHFRPFALADKLIVRPPWEPYEAKPGETVLELEPGRAFGTGLHETTSLVATALVTHAGELAGQDVLDVGCGSGILSLAALALGARSARAVDVDAEAIDVTRENAARNGLEARIATDTTDVGDIAGTFPVVVANIEARVLIPLAAALGDRVKPGGLLVLSGILAPQKDDVVRAYAGRFTLEEAPARGEWIALVLRASAAAPSAPSAPAAPVA